MLHYYQALAENRQAKIDEYLDTAEALKQTEISRAEELRYQEQLLVNLNGARSSLENQFAERERLLATLEGSIATTQEEIAANQANRERLETLVRNITTMTELSMLTDQRPFSEIQGQCKWPTQGRILASFGSLRTGNIRWDGMMIVSSMGNPVLSVHTGRVVFSDYLRGYGLLVIVDHDDGYLTLYGHNQTLFVEAGDWVQSEQMIARVGNSGGQRDAVLYFEIRKNGEPTNPANWCG
jgi:septal ring factor EnvC (AmiA/AmiB activator)